MLKKIFAFIALWICIGVLGYELNPNALKNPPAFIEFIDYQDGDVCYLPKSITYIKLKNIGEITFHSRIIRLSGTHKFQIIFVSSKGHAKKFFVENKGKFVELKINSARTKTASENSGVLYWVICEISAEQYSKLFIDSVPKKIRFYVPQISENILELNVLDEWKTNFQEMKSLFTIKQKTNEVQVKFQ